MNVRTSRMKRAQDKDKNQVYSNEPTLHTSPTQNQADNSASESFCFQVFDKNSRDSYKSSMVSKELEEVDDINKSPSKKRKKCATPRKKIEVPKVLGELEEEIERQLGVKAEKTNLTVFNVKNILKSVITNTDVLNMVQKSLSGEEIDLNYEPKLTRSKTKELLMMSPKPCLPPVLALTPVKNMPVSSECKVLIDRELSDSSSDEEYNPNEEEHVSDDDDEKDQASSVFSDLDSLPRTPASVHVHDTSQIDFLDDSVFVRPQENVGQRTRSKLSLSSLPLEVIEQSFVPPDITCDMYDSVCDNDDWTDFLKEFCQPLDEVVNEAVDDMEADPEYNVLADEDAEQVDKEELRVDRAVKVSRKELNALMAELREYTDMLSSEEDDNIDPSSFLPMSPISEEKINDEVIPNMEETEELIENTKPEVEDETNFKKISLSFQQECLLSQQMRQHVQLMTQHFLQTYRHPTLSNLAPKMKENLSTLYYLGEGKECTFFRPSNLEPALKIVSDWENVFNDDKKSQYILKFMKTEIQKVEIAKKRGQVYKRDFLKEMKELVLMSKAFIYPLLLPSQPFCPFHRRPTSSFSDHEDMLIALNLEQLIPYMKNNQRLFKKVTIPQISKLIVELNMQHTTYQVISRRINYLKKQQTHNPIKHYFERNSAPTVQHFIVPISSDISLNQQPPALFPETWRIYLLERLNKNTDKYTNR